MTTRHPLKIAALLMSTMWAMHSASAAPAPSPRPTIVLVHGAWETAAIWRPLAGRLRRDGYRVIVVNLPGRPGAALGPEKASLSAYRDAVMQAMEQESAPVVLVGHSFGGITITNVAEAVPDKVKTLVYLAAFVPEPGQSLLDVSKRDTGSRLASQLSVDQARGTVSIKPEARGPIMANDGTVAQQAELASMLVDEPLQPMATPVQWSAARAGKVDRVYLRTRLDQAVSPAFQSEMASNTPMRMTIDLETGHAPFVTMPDQLASAIEHILQ